MKKFLTATLVIPLILWTTTFAQTPEPSTLSLQDCIALAQSESPEAQIAENDYYIAYWNYRAFRSSLLPQFALNANLPGLSRLIDRTAQGDGTNNFTKQSGAFSSANLSIFQQLPWTGGSLSVSSGLQRIDQFDDGFNSASIEWRSTPIVVRFEQPLFRFNRIKWLQKSEQIQYRIAQRKRQENMEGIAVELSKKFFSLYQAEMNVENARFNVSVNDTIFNISKGRYNVGTIAENELLQIELELLTSQTDLTRAQLNYDRAQRDLKVSLGIPEAQTIAIIPPEQFVPFLVDPERAVHHAKIQHSDLLNFESRELSVEREVQEAKANSRINANIIASFGYNQLGANIDDAYKSLSDQQFFTLNLQVPLFQWGQSRERMQAALNQKSQTEMEIALEKKQFLNRVRFLAEEFRLLQNQVLIAAKADTIANRRFAVSKNRYLVGKIDITDLFDAQREKDSARQNYIQTLGDYWEKYYELRQMTLYDFREGKTLLSR